MALKDRFNILEIETENDNEKEQVIQETVVEADLEPIIDELAGSLSEKVASIPVWFEYSETEQRKLISDFLTNKLETTYSDISFSNDEKEDIISLFMNSILGFGTLDYYISKDEIKSILASSDGTIFIDNGTSVNKEETTISTDQFERIYSGLKGQANMSDSSIGKIRLNKLSITLFAPPLCEKKILFEKLITDKVDFDYLINDESINNEIYEFIKKLIDERKNILIAAPSSGGKTALLSAIAEEVSLHSRCAVFENYPIINSKTADNYILNSLNENAINDLLNVTSRLKYDYALNDTGIINSISDAAFEKGFYAGIDAETLTQAVTKLAAYRIYNEKCTEKQAKAFIASKFDYIFILEKNEKSLFKISSIAELSLNKTGSLVLTEILKYSDNSYMYNFSA